jgi:hypothetical protein
MNTLVKQVCTKLQKGKSIQTIAEETEESEDVIREIVSIAEKYAPDYDVTKIAEEYMAKKENLLNTASN